MSHEKAQLLPTAMSHSMGPAHQAPQSMRLVIVPGLEFDPKHRYTYGCTAFGAFLALFVTWMIVESRSCYYGPGLNMDRIQWLHISLMLFSFILFLLSLFSFADYLFQWKLLFYIGVLIIHVAAILMIWTVYLTAVSPCKATIGPVDLYINKTNVFNAGDAWGIIVLLVDILAALMLLAAASSFHKRF